jgi:cysteinyl-tRNA synthetase
LQEHQGRRCSTFSILAIKHLGPNIDIVCGGIDNLYRHHDYTKAIVEAAFSTKFATDWLHGEHLLINGQKMSKSKGNVIYVDNLLEETYRPEDIRFYLIYNHYRRKINFTDAGLKETSEKLLDFQKMVKTFANSDSQTSVSDKPINSLLLDLTDKFKEKMDDDLDVKSAFNVLYEIVYEIVHLRGVKISYDDRQRVIQELKKIDYVLQIIFPIF